MQTLTRRSTLAGGAALGAAALAGRAQAQALEKELVVYASHPSEMVDHFCNDFGQKNGIARMVPATAAAADGTAVAPACPAM